MRRLLAFIALTLLAALLGGCVDRGFAGQDTAGLTPSPEVVEPEQQSPTTAAAGQTPSILGSTPETGQVGAWQSHRFFDVWDIGYPDGWTIDRPGNGQVVLRGAYGEHEYEVDVLRPANVQAKDLPAWVQSDLEQINQFGAPRQEYSGQSLPAMKVTNLHLPGQRQGACPATRVYVRTDKLRGDQNYLMMTVMQTDAGGCDSANIQSLADALIADVRG